MIIMAQVTQVKIVEEASTCVHLYNRFMSRIEELGLPPDVDAKPILDVCFFTTSAFPNDHTFFRGERLCKHSISINRALGQAELWQG
jgi:hypothetical protein